jgi:hypothetical protein
VRHPIQGVSYTSALPDSIELRAACLGRLVPEDAVVTDRSAAWLLGAPMALAPNDHLKVPKISMFRQPGYRLRNSLVMSGERSLLSNEVIEIGGLRVTTALRTACDLGRLLHRDQAFAGIEAVMNATGLRRDLIVEASQSRRLKGNRGIRQFRSLAVWVDGRSQSPGESILRLRWLDCADLPPPIPQFEVAGPHGPLFLDLAAEGLRYAAEYDGAEWHGPEQAEHDLTRRQWLRDQPGYVIDVFTARNIHGPQQDAEAILRRGIARAQERAWW